MKCNGCGAQLRGGELFCPYCGTELEQTNQAQQPVKHEIHIHNHYQAQPDRVVERVYVDRPVPVRPAKSSRSRLVMLLLWFFFGVLGVHHFYTGRVGRGLLYLFTGGFCGIGVFVDFFVILLGQPTDRDGLPIKW